MTTTTTMTRLIRAQTLATWLRDYGVANAMEDIAHHIHDDFLRWPEFDKSARVACHSPDGVIELMPVADARLFSFKYVNGHPKNTRQGLSTVMAFGALADVDTGRPLLLSELTLTTALRTAAMSALAAQILARPDSRVMALIGNGAQSEFQALAFQRLLGITTLRVFDVDARATQKLIANLAGSGLQIEVCRDARHACEGADIVTTVTADKTNATILLPDMVAPGMHINAVGGDCPGKTELHAEVLRAGRVFVEFEPQSRIEGEIQQMPSNFAVTELWRVMLNKASGRTSPEAITVFDSVGFALEDYAALRYLYVQAQSHGLGEWVDLVPALFDPKDLFATVTNKADAIAAA